MNAKPRILFLCTGNACRSQMAEGWARAAPRRPIRVRLRRVAPAGVDPVAIQVMAEAGVDISSHRSKHVLEVSDRPFDYVVTLCEEAAQNCPTLPGPARVIRASRWTIRSALFVRRKVPKLLWLCTGVSGTRSDKLSRPYLRNLAPAAKAEPLSG